MTNLEFIKSKIYNNLTDIEEKINGWKTENKKIIFTNGCFDILHLGHVEYLAKTKDLGDKLIIGLNTDNSIKRIKGDDRPINNEHARSILLSSLFFVDAIILFDEDTPIKLIEKIKPNCLVKGNEYKAEDIVGYDIVKKNDGEIITIELTKGYSTTNTIKKLNKL
jgi:D-glycero-beta-D-manno-heptose 1-phosphate adenylyltransferase